MKTMEKTYWQSLENYEEEQQKSILENKQAVPEFSVEGLDETELKAKSSRRDFLKMMGFSVSAVALVSSCQMPIRKAIPLLNQPEDLIPGVPNFYASTFFDGNDYCSILVKTRENRPIKIEGNEMSPITKGGTSARIQASVLNLYDDARLKNPKVGEVDSNWETIDFEIVRDLKALQAKGLKVVLLTSTIISPSTKELIKEFTSTYTNVEWVMYDAVSYAAIRKANEMNFGTAVIPDYRFDKAKTIVSFDADFLGNWLMPVAYSKQFSTNRKLFKGHTGMSRLYVYESNLSLTGSNADYRFPIKPSEQTAVLLNLYNELAKATGNETFTAPSINTDVKLAAIDLLESKGQSLVVCGTNDVQAQLLTNAINNLLGNIGTTIDLNTPLFIKQGDDSAMRRIVKEMNESRIGGLLAYNVNPAYDFVNAEEFKSGLNKVSLKVAFSETLDETAVLCNYVCTTSNYLESWNDAEPVKGYFSFQQPSIRPIFNTRQFQDNLLKWLGSPNDFGTYIEKFWNFKQFEDGVDGVSFTNFFNKFKHDGVWKKEFEGGEQPSFTAQTFTNNKPSETGTELVLYQKISIGTGKYTNNPWLLELPDPITTATWDNYLCISQQFAKENNLAKEDVVVLNGLFEIPVVVLPGQAYGTVALALGFGRTSAGKAGNNIGKNAYQLGTVKDGFTALNGKIVTIEKVEGKTYPLAMTQMHDDMEDRPIVRETTLKEYKQNPGAGNEQHLIDEANNATLYQKVNYDGIHWGMTIDLSTCTGCANCVIACQAENNIPVIGKEQVRNRRIMHWVRIDRYFSKDPENPEVYHMPVMCLHCDNAPCENVCPVAATNHSSEGINQMAYNRCIGTKYCINNCPYKVRRFNWYSYVNNNEYDYNMNSDLGKMVLNPDVVVRQRGVVEKCSLCFQRIQEKKLLAKIENRELREGEVITACQQSCPTDAIQFGNLKNEDSIVVQNNKEARMYHLLEHLHTLPSTSYLAKVRNKDV
jgi:molybdopterin-containing oxidoreductase family iron-sulfur binding subunit